MKKHAWSIGIVLVAVGFAGATQGSPSEHEPLLKQAIESIDKIGATLKTILDEESANAAKPELRKSATAFIEARAKAAKLEAPSKEEKTRLEKLYKAKSDESKKKLAAQIPRVELIPGGRDALKEISAVLKNDGK